MPGRDRRRIALSRMGGNSCGQDRVGHSAPRAQPIRPGVRDRSSTARTEDGDHRAVRTGGDSASQGIARGYGRRAGFKQPEPGEREGGIITCLAAAPPTIALALSEPATLVPPLPSPPWPVDTTSQYRGLDLPSASS